MDYLKDSEIMKDKTNNKNYGVKMEGKQFDEWYENHQDHDALHLLDKIVIGILTEIVLPLKRVFS